MGGAIIGHVYTYGKGTVCGHNALHDVVTIWCYDVWLHHGVMMCGYIMVL